MKLKQKIGWIIILALAAAAFLTGMVSSYLDGSWAATLTFIVVVGIAAAAVWAVASE